MGGLHGVQNLKEVLDFGFAVGKGLSGALADGKLELQDAAFFLDAVMKVGPALKDVGDALKEFKELDAEDEKVLLEHGKSLFSGMPESKVLSIAKHSLKIALEVGLLLSDLSEAKQVPSASEGGGEPAVQES